MQILALDVSGTPRRWISLEEAVVYHVKGQVAWQYGDEDSFVARGGTQNDGSLSIVRTAPVIAVKAASGFAIEKVRRDVVLTNRTLFGRDRHVCAYCGQTYHHSKLSRDHIVPKSKGGSDTWMNVVTACKDCNCYKDDKTLEQADMKLLYVPYVPNHAEKMIIEGRNILADQMMFLTARLPKHSRLLT